MADLSVGQPLYKREMRTQLRREKPIEMTRPLLFQKPVAAVCFCLLLIPSSALAWSNRGHRMVNLVAAESLPADMPAFMRTPSSVAEISYLGPEPDRWRPGTEPELSNISSPDHAFRVELGSLASPLPRRRSEFILRLEQLRQSGSADTNLMRPERIGTLPWQAEEVFERLQSAFRSYRIATGDLQASAWMDEAPIRAEDLPYIQSSILYYSGWLGHYIGDGCMPLHDTINVAGWIEKDNPNGYTRNGSIHHRLELVADAAIEQHLIQDQRIVSFEASPRLIDDPFATTLQYLQSEGKYSEAVYKMEKQGALEKGGTPELDTFIEHRMAEGAAMLRDLIYTAWVRSKDSKEPDFPKAVPLVLSRSSREKK